MAEQVTLKVVLNGVEQSVSTLNELQQALIDTRAELQNVAIGSDQFNKLQKQFGDIDSQIRDLKANTKGVKMDELEATFLKFGETVTSSFALATSALAVFGAEGEDVAKAQAQAQQLLTIVITAKNLAEIAEGETAAARLLIDKAQAVQTTILTGLFGAQTVATAAQAAATGTATAAQLALNAAMKANPILLIIGAIGALIGAITLFSDSEEKAAESVDLTTVKLKEQEEQIKRVNQAREDATRLNGELALLDAKTEEQKLKVQLDNAKALIQSQEDGLKNLRDNLTQQAQVIDKNTQLAILQARLLKKAFDLDAPQKPAVTREEQAIIGLIRQLDEGKLSTEKFYAAVLDAQLNFGKNRSAEATKQILDNKNSLQQILNQINDTNTKIGQLDTKRELADKEYNNRLQELYRQRTEKITRANEQIIKSQQDLTRDIKKSQREIEFELLQSLARQGKAYDNLNKSLTEVPLNQRKETVIEGEFAIQKEILRIQKEQALVQAQFQNEERQKEIKNSGAAQVTINAQLKKLNENYLAIQANINQQFRIKETELDAEAVKRREEILKKLNEEISFGDFNIFDNKQRFLKELEKQDIQFKLNEIQRTGDTAKGIEDILDNSLDALIKNTDDRAKIQSQFIREFSALEFQAINDVIQQELKLRKDAAILNRDIKISDLEAQRQLEIENQTKVLKDAGFGADKIGQVESAITEKYNKLKVQAAKETIDEISGYEVDAVKKTNAAKIAQIQEYTRLSSEALNAGFQFLQAAQQNDLDKTKEKYDAQFTATQQLIQNELNAELAAIDKSTGSEEEKNKKKQASIEKFNKRKADADKKTNEAMLKEENKIREKQFKAEKALNIAKAVINGAQAITSILAQYPKFDGGFAMAAAIAASVITTAAQIAVISSQEYTPEGTGAAKDLQVPDLSTTDTAQQAGINEGGFTLFNPNNVNVTSTGGRNTGGQAGLGPMRVYVLESDITDAQRRVKTTVEQASFG